MKVKTAELTGPALDWAVELAKGTLWMPAEGCFLFRYEGCGPHGYRAKNPQWPYSSEWSAGGPIIEREKIELRPGLYHSKLWAAWGQTQHGERNSQQGKTGPTPLVAAMRCFVASKLGEEVDVPEELRESAPAQPAPATGSAPPAAPAAPAPLTNKQIEQGWRDTFSTSNPFCPCDLKSFTKAVRWAEARAARKGDTSA